MTKLTNLNVPGASFLNTASFLDTAGGGVVELLAVLVRDGLTQCRP